MTERTRTLNNLTDDLEQVKREMDERGSSMTDGSGLISLMIANQTSLNFTTHYFFTFSSIDQH